MVLNLTVIVQGGGAALDKATKFPTSNSPCELETALDVELDMAMIGPNVSAPAEARLCACAVAEATKAGSEQACDCANCWEICVPTILNDSVSPLSSLAMFCCSVVRLATVAFVFVRDVVRLKVHCSMGWLLKLNEITKLLDETLVKFAAVIPDPCKAASTSSSPV